MVKPPCFQNLSSFCKSDISFPYAIALLSCLLWDSESELSSFTHSPAWIHSHFIPVLRNVWEWKEKQRRLSLTHPIANWWKNSQAIVFIFHTWCNFIPFQLLPPNWYKYPSKIPHGIYIYSPMQVHVRIIRSVLLWHLNK